MDRRQFTVTAGAALAAFALAACRDKPAEPIAAAPARALVAPREAYEIASRGDGFTVGPIVAANTVYVFFDTTCPHCAQLWEGAKPLAGKLKLVWMPIALLRPSSGPQGATILSAADPIVAMTRNEALVLERKGGIAVDPALSDQAKARVQHNTELFAQLGADSVPLIVFKNAKTGVFGAHSGAVDTAELAAMAGV